MEILRSKLLGRKKEAIAAGLVFLVASLSFALGYLANRQASHAPIIIEKYSGYKI